MNLLRLVCLRGHENARSLESYARHPYCLEIVRVGRGATLREYICREEIDEISVVRDPQAKRS